MPLPPTRPKIYHITHVGHLPQILADGVLLSDAAMIRRGGATHPIGMNTIKERRLRLPVHCHPGQCVGDYVPFYFCPRSIMLYVLHRANHPELTYHGGQGPIVHLEAELYDVIDWAKSVGRPWAFSLSNAGAYYTEFRAMREELDDLNWPAIASNNFQADEIKEGKQAEFLMYESFPWELVSRIGVRSIDVHTRVASALVGAAHRPRIEILPNWYY